MLDLVKVFHKHAKGAEVTGPTGDRNIVTGGVGVSGTFSAAKDGTIVTELRLPLIDANHAVQNFPDTWAFSPDKFAS